MATAEFGGQADAPGPLRTGQRARLAACGGVIAGNAWGADDGKEADSGPVSPARSSNQTQALRPKLSAPRFRSSKAVNTNAAIILVAAIITA
jgi:hypothetical protein